MKVISHGAHRQYRAYESALSNILEALPSVLKKAGGEYFYNEPGSGEVSYRLNGKLLEFNEFAMEFRGFFIDGKKVSALEFLLEIAASKK